MIIARIHGGLGNQLFQYAAGMALAERHGVQLKLDLRWMRRYTRRPFLLDRFAGLPPEITVAERLRFTWFPFRRNPPFVFTKAIRRLNPLLYLEPSIAYDPAFEALGPDCFLWGLFQSERYFGASAASMRAALAGAADRRLYPAELLRAVDAEGSVAVQYRRGDYVTHAKTSRSIGTCGPQYYRDAIAFVRERVARPRFVVFSDDIAWCREHAGIPDALYVTRSGGTPVDDLHLASTCRHIVLANSTFSWWSAWLNENPDLVAVAPRRWFRSPALNELASELVPARWTRL